MSTTEPLLLPCPFCWGDAEPIEVQAGSHFVRCTKCNASLGDGSPESAIAAWNRRSTGKQSLLVATPLAPAPELWALCYLHDWDPPKEGQAHRWEPGKNVFPEVDDLYLTWQEAEAARNRKMERTKYWVRRARIRGGNNTISAAPVAPTTPAPNGWQSIETAPKDGAWFLAIEGKEIFRTQGSFGHVWVDNGKGGHMPDPNRKSFTWLASEFDSLSPWNPTHWMPLPVAPTEARDE